MEEKDLIAFKNSKEWIEFDKYYNYSSFMKKVGFYKYEDPNTNFLASILKEDFNGTNYALRLLIELIKEKSNEFNGIDLMSKYELKVAEITTRKNIEKVKPDLFINCFINDIEYVIAIEAKLHSLEGPNQCKKYEEVMNKYETETCKKNNTSLKKIFLFLDKDTSTEISSSNFIKITYSDLLDYIYTPCSFRLNDNELLHQLNEYIKGFIEFYNYDIDSKQVDFIPLSYEGKELTLNLWKNHNELLKKLFKDRENLKKFYKLNENSIHAFVINTLKLESEKMNLIDAEIKKMMESLLNSSSKKNKFNGTPCNNVDLIYHIFKKISGNIKQIEDIPETVLITTRDWKNIVSDKEIKTSPRKDYYYLNKGGKKPIEIGGERYWYCNISTGDEIEQLISAVKEAFPDIFNDNNLSRDIKF